MKWQNNALKAGESVTIYSILQVKKTGNKSEKFAQKPPVSAN